MISLGDSAPDAKCRVMLIRAAKREYRTWIVDSRRWTGYRPRSDDVIVASHPKCGTTWMQRIVHLLIFKSTEPRPVDKISPWIDRRFPVPLNEVLAGIEAQQHRRSLKTHLPLDGLPLFDEVKYIHIARDGRDACMSYHNHVSNFTAETLARLDREGLEDETIGRPYPRASKDPAQFFRRWISQGEVPGHTDGSPFVSFFVLERTYWSERKRPNFLLLHYNDLKADLQGEMQKIAAFLNIEIPTKLWPQLIEAASFEAMRRDGAKIAPGVTSMFERGAETFFFKASNERWRGVLTAEDLAFYNAKVRENFSRSCAVWVEQGRSGGTDPRNLPS